MSSKFAARLKKMNTTWKKSEKQAKEMFTKVDAGVYLAQLQGMELVESSAGNLQIKRQHLIAEGEFQGVTVYDNLQLETSDLSMAFVRREIDGYGYECPAKAEDLEGVVIAIAKEAPEVKIRITHSGEFTNVTVVELIGEGGGAAEEEGKYSEAEIRAMNRTSLVSVVEEEELSDIDTEELSLSEIRDAVLEGLGITEGDEEVEEGLDEEDVSDEEEPETDSLQSLRDFCTAQDIDFEDDADEDKLKESINEYEYPEDTLTEEEIETLKEVGLEGCLQKLKKTKKV